MKTITAHLQSIPPYTPSDGAIYLAGNFNNWQPGDERYRFRANGDGSFRLDFQAESETLEYKITRGNWVAAEGDARGNELPNRVFKAGSQSNDLWMRVESWTDLQAQAGRFAANVLLLHPEFQIPQLGRTRRIWACLPPDYWSGRQRYPVVYMQDGQNLFDNPGAVFGSWGIDRALNRLFLNGRESSDAGRQPIIIGIENGGENRIGEYSPWKNARHGGGEGEQYLDFITDTLKPFVDEHLRTRPEREHTAVMGSSMGGLISLYAALAKPAVFGMAGVFSPSLWFSREVFQLVKDRPATQAVRILLMAGQQESQTMVGDLLDLYETLLEAGHAEDNLHYDLHSDGTHSEWFWAREFEHALQWLFGERPDHAHGISNETVRFEVNRQSKELLIRVSPYIREPQLEIRDYCHNRQFRHALNGADNRIPYAEWENCIYSVRLLSEGDLVFSRRVSLEE